MSKKTSAWIGTSKVMSFRRKIIEDVVEELRLTKDNIYGLITFAKGRIESKAVEDLIAAHGRGITLLRQPP